jgi:hypothetical protein
MAGDEWNQSGASVQHAHGYSDRRTKPDSQIPRFAKAVGRGAPVVSQSAPLTPHLFAYAERPLAARNGHLRPQSDQPNAEHVSACNAYNASRRCLRDRLSLCEPEMKETGVELLSMLRQQVSKMRESHTPSL